jgi:sialic acid synthase SpsE
VAEVATSDGPSAVLIKCQFFTDRLTHPNSPGYSTLQALAPPPEKIFMLAETCREYGLRFGCTIFHKEDLHILTSLKRRSQVGFLKIGSPSLIDTELICAEVAAVQGVNLTMPLLISTGGTRLWELIRLELSFKHMSVLKGVDDSRVMMHCISEYPESDELNLSAWGDFMHLRNVFDWKLWGASLHSSETTLAFDFIELGAHVVEIHVKFNKSQVDAAASIRSDQAIELIEYVQGRAETQILNNVRSRAERDLIQNARLFLFAKRGIGVGEVLDDNNVTLARGIQHPDHYSVAVWDAPITAKAPILKGEAIRVANAELHS